MKSTWNANRNSSGWGSGLAEWTDGNTAFLSVVFSWQVASAYSRALFYQSLGYHVRVGGPAVILNGEQLAGVAEIGGEVNALPHHNPNATFTTRGCIRQCKFCAVPKIEGALRELDDWEVKPIVCDNNFLASSRKHFDSVIDKLKDVAGVDFNQGLDARILTQYQADRLAELDIRCVRLAWDHSRLEKQFMSAFEKLRASGIPASLLHVYVLIGYGDTPDDALYRLETVKKLGAYPNPMRYQPLDSKRRNDYVAPNWTDAELKRYMRYWSNLRITRRVPFSEFRHRGKEPGAAIPAKQMFLILQGGG